MLRRSQTLVFLLLLPWALSARAQPAQESSPTAEKPDAAKKNDSAEAKEPKTVEKVEVTGSRIRQLDLEGPKPVITIERKDLDKSGAVNLSEALNKMSIASFGSVEYGSSFGTAEGTASIDLRGLGEGNTLVLLNGRRMIRDPNLEFVDLSVIPVAAIERVEILTGTASAIYGTDALAGVINIITRKDYEGMTFGYSKTKPRFKGGDRDQFYILAGTHGDKTSNLITLQWDESKSFLAKDRPWFDTGNRSSYGTPFSYETADGFQPVGTCAIEQSDGAGNYCGYNYWDQAQLQGSWQKISAIEEFIFRASDDTKINFRLFVAKKTARTAFSPDALDPSSDGYTVSEEAVDALHPELKNGAAAPVFNPDPNFGNAPGVLVQGLIPESIGGTKTDQTVLSTSFGVTHSYGEDSEIDFNVTDSRLTRTHIWTDMLDDTKFRTAVFTGEYDVLAEKPTGDISKYRLDVPDTDSGTAKSVELSQSGTFGLFSKRIGYSIGLSHILESYSNHASANKLGDQIKGLGGGGGSGDRAANAVFSELAVPLGKGLDLTLAGRFDSYSDFGTTVNPMAGLQYRFDKYFFTRLNVGTGFKAPTLRELHDQEARYFTAVTDYKRCNEAKAAGNQDDIDKYCLGIQSTENRSGGNTELDPQTSQSLSLFMGFEPVIGSGVSVEYFNQQIKDVITSISPDELMQLEADGRALPNGTEIRRDATTGDVTEIVSPSTNLSTVKASGLTFAGYTAKQAGRGKFTYRADYSYYLSYLTQKLPGGKFEQLLEEYQLPRWRWSNTFGYEIGTRESVALTSNSNGRYQKANKSFGYVGSYTSWDLHYAFVVNKTYDYELGGTNIFNQNYPVDDSDAVSRGVGNSFYPLLGPTMFARVNVHL